MTKKDQITVVKYLKSLDIRSMEFFEEMYDHILSSFQSRKDLNQNIDVHLRDVVQPGFGGAKGIQRVMKSQQKLRQKAIFKRAKDLFLSYLISWPTVLITMVIALVIFQLNALFRPKDVLLIIMTTSALIPASIALGGQIKFYFDCKRQNKPYSSSDLNKRLLLIAAIGTNLMNVLLNVVAKFIWGSQKGGLEAFSSYSWLQITLSVLFVLYALVVIQLLKEKFITKLAI
ncbi:hypothetical protein [Roseivirga sp. E12]|uniref:hypothetical protein n=1 Tax=Roseivirga sp. E12 TaxID=2819237 RepID=UPI001ABBEFEC|nr:hypothetical protein [Roseivirga sp. E12]MBO3697795.1 hypothetical protein [Roseivirga sp. E12]